MAESLLLVSIEAPVAEWFRQPVDPSPEEVARHEMAHLSAMPWPRLASGVEVGTAST